jgi:predicted Zn-dependent protease
MSAPWGARAVDQALELSRTEGCVVIARETSSVNVRWAGSSLTTNGTTRDRSLTVVAVDGPRVGIASRDGDIAGDAIRDLVEQAERASRTASAAPDAQPLLTPAEAGTSTSPWDLAATTVSISDLGSFTGALATVFEQGRGEGWSLAGYAEESICATWLGSSTGVRLRHDQPDGHVGSTARTAAGERSAWAGRHSPKLEQVDVAGIGDELSRLMTWSQRRVDLPAGRYDTVLPPTAVADLLVYFLWSLSGRAADEGRSAFSRTGGGNRIGERLGVPGLKVVSDPALAPITCAPFLITTASGETESVFDNGLPVGRTAWVDDGVLSHLADTRASAAGAGRSALAPPSNVHVDAGGNGTTGDVVSRTSRGLLLTSLWYIRGVDPQTLLLTGLTRDGVFLVEDGEIVGAVNNFRWNESPVDLLSRITDSGAPEPTMPREWGDYWTLAVCPPARVAGFNMSSVSQAT